MKKFIVFDLDGTLIDTLEGLTVACSKFLDEFNFPYRYEKSEIKEFIGNGSRKLFLSITHRLSFDDQLEEYYKEFLKIYEETQYISEPFPEVRETLKKLNKMNVDLIIYSNKPNDILVKLINSKFSDIKFLKLQGNDENYKTKPDVTLLNKILDENNLNHLEGLYVGDSYTDFLTAINAQMDMLFLNYGYCHKKDAKKIECIKINYFNEILNYLK